MKEETMAIVLRGHPESLNKAERMLKGMLDIHVVHVRRSKGKLWISERRQHKSRRYESEPEEDEDIYIGGEIYPRQEIERIASEWRDSYIIH